MQELPEDDQDQDNKPWHWSRKFKVFMLTVVCIIGNSSVQISWKKLLVPERVTRYCLHLIFCFFPI